LEETPQQNGLQRSRGAGWVAAENLGLWANSTITNDLSVLKKLCNQERVVSDDRDRHFLAQAAVSSISSSRSGSR